MAEVFNSVPAGLKTSVALPKTYFIRASDARKYNGGNRYLKISTPNQPIPEPIRDWLIADFRHKQDFQQVENIPGILTETVEPVLFAPLPEIDETTILEEQVSEPIIEVDLETDTLYIQAYDANIMYSQVDADDFAEMNLAELQLYVTHYSIDIGRATSENTIRERVLEWYNDANTNAG